MTKILPSKQVTIDETSINYVLEGKGKEYVLLLHGFGLSLNSWDYIKKGFDPLLYTLVLIDLKGFGLSGKPLNSDYTIKKQAEIVLGLLHHLKINEIILIGHSYGGVVALYLNYLIAQDQPGLKIKKEILIDAPAYPDITLEFLEVLQNKVLRFISLKILPARLLARHVINTTFYQKKKTRTNLLERYTHFFALEYYDEAMMQIAEQVMPTDMEKVIEHYKNISFPVLILWGSNDRLVDKKYGIRLHNDIKTSELFILDKCGHVPHEEKPATTIKMIMKFLNGGMKSLS